MTKTMVKTIFEASLLLTLASCAKAPPPADPYKFTPGEACIAPVKPVGYADIGAISAYHAKRDKFITCVRQEDPSSPTYQTDLSQSQAMIGDDQFDGSIIQQDIPHPLVGRSR